MFHFRSGIFYSWFWFTADNNNERFQFVIQIPQYKKYSETSLPYSFFSVFELNLESYELPANFRISPNIGKYRINSTFESFQCSCYKCEAVTQMCFRQLLVSEIYKKTWMQWFWCYILRMQYTTFLRELATTAIIIYNNISSLSDNTTTYEGSLKTVKK